MKRSFLPPFRIPLQPQGPWKWIPSLYFAEGVPLVLVMIVSVIMYKNLGVSNTEIAFYTGWLYLPWVIKPIWSPIVDIFGTRRHWILVTQLLIGAGFAGIALTLPAENFFRYSLAVFWLIAFSSATHDIAADGFYITALTEKQRAWFVGIRSTFYRVAMIAGQGLLVMLAGYLEQLTDSANLAWVMVFYLLAGLMVLLFAYHSLVLPRPQEDQIGQPSSLRAILAEVASTFVSFFKKKHIGKILAFLLLYRFAEAQLVKMAAPFLLDGRDIGGLNLTTTEVGFTYGTVGVVMLSLGGILGGLLVARNGLTRYWILWMVAAINLPNAVYLLLSLWQPQSLVLVNVAVGFEQFGYGFGFTAYMVFMMYVAQGQHSTAHFAICTGFMALGMMIPGMVSGWLQESLGYTNFFQWILISTIPSFLVAIMMPLDADFGQKMQDTP